MAGRGKSYMETGRPEQGIREQQHLNIISLHGLKDIKNGKKIKKMMSNKDIEEFHNIGKEKGL